MKPARMLGVLATAIVAFAVGCASGNEKGSDAVSPADTPATGDESGPNGTCPFAGTWSGTIAAGPFAGQTNVWELRSGGTWTASMGAGTVNGTWSAAGATLTVIDTDSTPAYVACPASQAGTYAVTFSTDCQTMTLQATDEPCDGRKAWLDGFAPART